MNDTKKCTNFFTHDQLTHITSLFTKNLRTLVPSENKRWCLVDQNGLAAAMQQASIDVGFIRERRGLTPEKGISPGKLAGVILYRLCRHKFVHIINEDILLQDVMVHAQEDAAIATALDLLNVQAGTAWIFANSLRTRTNRTETLPELTKELRVLITTRHYNQESLGIFLDSLCHLDEAALARETL